ncbi:MAG: M4 family metallopeptidase [Myxococcales bacterium]|nr:M4 family metallopeptidase [Myxococcales bacterium]
MTQRGLRAHGLWMAAAAAVWMLGCEAQAPEDGPVRAGADTPQTPAAGATAVRTTAADAVEAGSPEAEAIERSLHFLALVRPDLQEGLHEAAPLSVNLTDAGLSHTRLRQTIDGVPVFGRQAIVHLSAAGELIEVTDGFAPGLHVDTAPMLSAEEAIEAAVASHGGWAAITRPPLADLQVLERPRAVHLTYRVQLHQFAPDFDPAMPVVFVDAHDGSEVWEYDNLKHAPLSDSDKETWDMRGRTNYMSAVLADDSAGDSVASGAHQHVGDALAYFQSAHGRDSFDGSGALVRSYVHYGKNYVNAYWDGIRLTFGDGDGVVSGPLATRDVVAHELSHGVTEHSADLIYAGESGALNEATSDIFAAAVEAAVEPADTDGIWTVGEDCWLDDPEPGDSRPAALRYMDDPVLAGDYDYYPSRYSGSSDNGGVHWNSGIANLFFHLLANGGARPREAGKSGTQYDPSVAGIGIAKAADVWYGALTNYMTQSSSFGDARTATLSAAADLGLAAADIDAIKNAWAGVGVWEFDQQSSTPGVHVPEGDMAYFTFPAGSEAAVRFVLRDETGGSSGDADLYVRYGSDPTTNSYDCASTTATSNEACELYPQAGSGDYHVMVHAWASGANRPGDVTVTLDYLSVTESAQGCSADADCDDGNPCTDNVCSGGSCVRNDNSLSCDDGDACTVGDICSGGSCIGSAMDCDDGIGCTVDSCDAGACINRASDALCDDGNACTDNICDVVAGTCSTVVDDKNSCSDGDTCTDDVCSGGVCSSSDNGSCNGCLPLGASCDADSDCCGGKCRGGGPGGKSCK